MSHERCTWAGRDLLYVAYHDHEWGVPQTDPSRLFEMLVLEGAQAGLSWITILRKRANYWRAFESFDPQRVARFTRARIARLMADPGIVRNRLKVEGAVRNARLFVDLAEETGDVSAWFWQFVGIGCDEPGAQETRVHICRLDHLLFVHAGHRHGERPHDFVLPLPGNHESGEGDAQQ